MGREGALMRPAEACPVAQRRSVVEAMLRVHSTARPGLRVALALPSARWHGQALCMQLGLSFSLALLLEQTLLTSRVLGLRRAL